MINKEKINFFKNMEKIGLALTFDDVRLKTKYTDVRPVDVCLDTKFSKHVSLKMPIVSAAMDSVTEYEMAIEMAKMGGIGIIHRNLSPKEQAEQVAKVKAYHAAYIPEPVCVYEDETMDSVFKKRKENNFFFHTFPVLSRDNKLEGMLYKENFEFCNDYSLLVKNVMTKNVVTAKKGISLQSVYDIMQKNKQKVLPIVDEQRKLCGMYLYNDVKRILSDFSTMYNLDKKGRLIVGAAIGVLNDAFERLDLLMKEEVDVVVMDTAHADSKIVIDTLKQIKKKYKIDVVVGNITEASSAKRLIEAGADGIKVGQGPGSACTTRIVAGVGCPQVTAIFNCAQVAAKYNVPICADGGIKYSGDLPIAIGAGANSIMVGNILAGTKETPGDTFFFEGRLWKTYRGMDSLGAIQKNRTAKLRFIMNEE